MPALRVIMITLGFINFILVLYQFFTGMRYIKFRPKLHRKAGILLVVTGGLHGAIGVLGLF